MRVKIPRIFKIGDSEVNLGLSDVFKAFHEELFALRLDPATAVKALESLGFRRTALAIWKGEITSLIRRVSRVWELHVRVYPDGYVTCEYEISRVYIQHFTSPRVYSCYELYELLRAMGVKAELVYKGTNVVSEVKEVVELEIPDPPFLLGVHVFISALGLTTALALAFIRR